MSNGNMPAEISAIILGVIFFYISYVCFTTPGASGISQTFLNDLGLAFGLVGVVSLLTGIYGVVKKLR